ncbi:MAG: flagellar basal body L-ring protein FlgH [Planctomycetes bacterium]|nr:flagellar basal body L-ring protein FlgH [Planctomycetota bacterium]
MTMIKHIARAVGLLAVLAAPAAAQNPYVRAGAHLRARNVGDILTITIQEQHSVKNQEQVQRRNDSSLAARLEAYSLSEDTFKTTLPRIDVRKESDFQGESRQNSGSEVRASIAVVVVDVQPNGNLVVAGTRSVTVNDETRTLRISGLVRALDVSPLNTVGSAMVADARISILGEGGGVRQVTRGPVGAMFDTLIWACWPF